MNIDIHKKRKYCYNSAGEWHNLYGYSIIQQDGYKMYYVNNNRHNIHGPAVIYPDGTNKHYLDGVGYFKEYWEQLRHDY